MRIFQQNTIDKIYFLGLSFLMFCLPLSEFGTSLSELILFSAWIIEFNYKQKLKILISKKYVLFFLLIFIVHALWLLLPNQDFNYAYNDLKIKVPLLVLPIILSTSVSLKSKQIKTLLLVFVSGVLLGSLISFIKFIIENTNVLNYRELSMFISHIRFSLMNVFSFIILYYYSFVSKDEKFSRKQLFVSVALMIWFIIFLFLLKCLTGIVVFIVLLFFYSVYKTIMLKHYVKYFILLSIITIPVIIFYYFNKAQNNFNISNFDVSKTEKYTASGNLYSFNLQNKSVENGNLVWVYYNDDEVKKQWNIRSQIPYSAKDANGNEISYTIMRYLTSRGLRKDSVGIWSLKNNEIKDIENGVANYIYMNKWEIYPLIYNVFWEVYEYKNTENANGHSLTLRIEYLKVAYKIIKENFWTGVGTGGVKIAFDNKYNETKSKLDIQWRKRAHNQFVTLFLTFGIFGFIIIMCALFYPILITKSYKKFLFNAILLIILLSFFNEDTLETQAGVTLFVIFYSLFVFSDKKLS